MPELLFEIGCEELPATFVAPTMAQMEQGFRDKFAAAKLWDAESGAVTVLRDAAPIGASCDRAGRAAGG